jgi:hypothetical protein
VLFLFIVLLTIQQTKQGENTVKKRVFFQGDRDIAGREREAAIEIMKRLGEQGYAANVGAYGELVAAICEAGVEVRCHLMDPNKDREVKTDAKAEIVDCVELAKQIGHPTKEVAWGIRLGILMETSNAFVFMPGREGTRAHLDPVIAFNLKAKNPKKIALIGWKEEDVKALHAYFHLGFGTLWIEYFRIINYNYPINQIIDFLTT